LLNKAIDHDVRAFEVIPSQIDNLFKLGQNNQLGAIEQLILTGEPLKKDLIERILATKPSLEIINTYGQTECSDVTTMYRITKDKDWNHRMVGNPIQNTQHFILDENRAYCPIGVSGEIYTAGPGVSRGYLNQIELTENVFLSDSTLTDQRVYKTGDLGRWTSEGEIEILGRADQQIKIRGFRIELGEIEQAILKQPEVAETVVQAIENEEGEKELVAYLTVATRDNSTIESDELNSSIWRRKLKDILPDYMLPLYFVRLEKMPLTSNGKIDKKSLPKPKDLGLTVQSNFVEPKTELEQTVAEIWQEILNHERVGTEDDFFALGGHSLKAVRITNAYFEQLGVKMPLQELFANTTISSHVSWMSDATTEAYEAIPVADTDTNGKHEFPVSDAQRRLWILSQFEDSSVAYNMPGQVFLNEAIQVDHFKKAIHATIERHEILRTLFKETGAGELVQKVIDTNQFEFNIETVDFRAEADTMQAIRSYVDQDTRKSFNLENGPLIRAALLQIAENEFEFYYNTHHIISDGWSGEVLANDVFAFYEASINNTEPNLPELRVQYKDYANWQLEQLKGEAFEDHRSFWKSELSGELSILDLPTYKQRPGLKTHAGKGKRTLVDQLSLSKLKRYSQDNGGSLFMGLLTVWNVLMHRYTGQTDVIIGTPVAGRDHPDLENQIGFYVNTLALRNRIVPTEDTFATFFEKVKRNTLDAYDHQQYPFDRLVDELEMVRDTSRNAVFDIMMKLMNIAENESQLESVEAENEIDEIINLGWMAAKFDLEVSFQELGDHLSFELVYNSDVYDDQMIVGLMNHFKSLLSRITDQPYSKIAEIDFLSDTEKEQLTETFNNTERNTKEYTSIIQMFEDQVAETPNRVALRCENSTMSYEYLNAAANQFADYLSKERQISSGDLVGVKLERNEWLIISILGVLKTGAAYVSIDPEYPQERIEFIEKDTAAKLCIDIDVIRSFGREREKCSVDNKSITLEKDQLAYIIYTSGSTGTPKGVMIPHGSVGSLISWSHKEFAQTIVDEVFFTTSINFDLSVFEMFFPLTSGKSVRILKDGLEIPAYLDHDRDVMVNTVPSVVGTLLQEGVDLSLIAALNMAGEPIPQSYKDELAGRIDEIRNLYGPSEDTTYTTCMRVDQDQRDLIGSPIDNTEIYVLNDSLSLQPVGVVGEICISGEGLAKGYLNQEKLTAEKFINNPFKPGTKCYKTGDMGRWLPDGNLQFAGRKDRQVKIRGYRIELNEITRELLAHKSIDNGLVATFTNDREGKELVVYFTISNEEKTNNIEGSEASVIEELRALLKSKLPAYMVPSYFVELDEMPLTPNGKIDEKGLP
ncbi:MAG: amino acid adenylation domain-containing protein, partial [Crocinitomicaceae bacterium]